MHIHVQTHIHTYTVEYYSAIKEKKILLFATICIDKYYMFTLI